MNEDKLIIASLKKKAHNFSELRVDNQGRIYFDGELFDESNPKHNKIAVSRERYRRIETGEETRKMQEASKKAKKGTVEIITDINTDNRSQKTTIIF